MTSAEILDRLRACPLFREFTGTELAEFVQLLDPREVNAGECIVKQDEAGDSMYLLVTGRAHVVHHRDGRSVELAVLEEGDFFGELALVDQGPRSADVSALEDCVLLGVTQPAMAALAGVYPMAAFKFLITLGRILVSRLRKSNQRYIDSMLFPLNAKE
jgi:CRP-like cAMP-binding protein